MIHGNDHVVVGLPTGFRDKLFSLLVCRKKILDTNRILEIHDTIENYQPVMDDSVSKYIDNARRISSIIGLAENVLHSLLVYAGLTIQLPYSMYYLLSNSGYRFGGWDPLRCPVLVDKEAAGHVIVIMDTPNGVYIGHPGRRDESSIPPTTFHALLDSLHGFTYTVIDSLVASGAVKLYMDVVEKYGAEYYLPLNHMLVTRVSEILGFGRPSPIVIGFRISELFRIAKTTINLFRGLALRHGL